MTPLDAFTRFVRVMQIIVSAMTAGCVFFMAIALAVVFTGGRWATPNPPMLTYIASAVTAAIVLLRVFLPGIVVAKARERILRGETESSPGDSFDATETQRNEAIGKFVQLFMTKLILSAALVESAVFLMLVAYLAERSPISLAFAVMLLFLLAAHFPTRAAVVDWIDRQMR